MIRRFLRPSLSVAAATVAAASCSSFGSTERSAPDDAGSAADAVLDAGGTTPPSDADASVPPFDLAYRAACPRPAAGKCVSVATCEAVEVHRPAQRTHPFGIAVDARHVFWLSLPPGADATDGYNGKGPGTLHRLDRATKAVVVLAREQTNATKLIAHGPDLYWGAYDGSSYELRTIRKDAAPCDADSCSKVAVVTRGLSRPARLEAAGAGVAFVMAESGVLTRVALGTGARAHVGTTDDFPSIVVGKDAVFASSMFQKDVRRFTFEGADAGIVGSIAAREAGANIGAVHLTTSCSSVFAAAFDDRIEKRGAAATGGTFSAFASIGPLDIYSAASDARFLYYGAANGGGLRMLDHTATSPAPVAIYEGSIWDIAVADDAIAFGEHGSGSNDTGPTVGSIFLIAK